MRRWWKRSVAELLHTPLAGPTEWVPRVHARLGRHELRVANIESALAQIACVPGLRALRRQLEAGQVPSQETALWRELLEHLSPPAGLDTSLGVPRVDRGMRLADPTALAALVTPDLPLAQVPGSLCWLTCLMTLFSWHVPLAVLGRWCGVHQTTIRRWVVGLALALGPRLAPWIGERVQAQRVYVDETWLKIRGRWQYGFVVVDVHTALPVLTALLPSRSPWAWSLAWAAAACAHTRAQSAHHRWVTGLCLPGAGSNTPLVSCSSPARGDPVAHAARRDRRGDRRPQAGDAARVADPRYAHGSATPGAAAGTGPGVGDVPRGWRGWRRSYRGLLGVWAVLAYPRPPMPLNASSGPSRGVDKTRTGFHAVLSATRELLLLLVVYLFTPHATTGQAPIEVIVPEARRMPLYRLINDPFRALQERASVKSEATMADVLRPQAAAA